MTEKQQRSQPCHRLYSAKANRVVMCRGQLKADAVMMAEGDPDIATLCETPVRVMAPIGTMQHFTFDLATVRHADSRETLYSVRWESQLVQTGDGRGVPLHWNAVEAWCGRNAIACRFLTDRDIGAAKTRVRNWRALLPLVRTAIQLPDPQLTDEIKELFEGPAMYSFAELPDQFPRYREPMLEPIAARLLHIGYLDGALDDSDFSRHTRIRRRPVDA